MTFRPTLVFGLGRSGLGVLRQLRRLSWPAEWADEKPKPEDEAAATALGFGRALDLSPARFAQVIA
ncbi:MAG TPA: hypothetical protein VHN99_03520, partial [Deinococcales bacterium]|nr:hypothetical protein [Deinococcales bacterium]